MYRPFYKNIQSIERLIGCEKLLIIFLRFVAKILNNPASRRTIPTVCVGSSL